MNWQKSLFVFMLVGVVTFFMVGCGKAEESVPTTDGTMPAPPEWAAPGERPPVPEMDFATAAEKLGVTEQQLRDALGDLSQGPPDLADAAEKLGVSEDSLREALGLPGGAPPAGGSPPGGFPPSGSPPDS